MSPEIETSAFSADLCVYQKVTKTEAISVIEKVVMNFTNTLVYIPCVKPVVEL